MTLEVLGTKIGEHVVLRTSTSLEIVFTDLFKISRLCLWYVLPKNDLSRLDAYNVLDVPSHAYQLSFESWPDWSQFYAGQQEIWQYWNKVANKYNVRDFVRFQHKCLEASWDERRSKWTVKLQRLDLNPCITVKDEADVLITGTGILNEWKWPNIEGLNCFKGELLHTAAWDENFNPEVS